jgi:hypothetical protein
MIGRKFHAPGELTSAIEGFGLKYISRFTQDSGLEILMRGGKNVIYQTRPED